MTTTLQDLKPSQIKPNKANPRGEVGDVAELAASISEKGIVEPLIVAPTGTGTFPTFMLIAGHRRLAAAKIAKAKTVPCIVREDLTDPAEQLETMLVENLQRTDLTPIEEAQAYQQLLEFPGYTMARISKATGRSAATVKARVGLAKLPASIRTKLDKGQVTLNDAQAIVEFAAEPDITARLERALGSSNFPFELERARADRKAIKDWAAAEAKLKKAGVRLVTDDQLEELVEQHDSDNYNPSEVWAYVDPEGDLDDLRVTPEFHATCPGHAAMLEQSSSWHGNRMQKNTTVRYVCTQPKLHPELGEPREDDESDEEKAERLAAAERRAEADRVREQLALAATVRRAHLAGFAISDEADDVAADLLADVIAARCSGLHTREVLDEVLFPNGGVTATATQIREEARKLSLASLAVLVDVAENAAEDQQLLRPESWGPSGNSQYYQPHKLTEQWRQRLAQVYGYAFSDIEAQLNAPPAIVDVDLPADDAADA